MPGMYVTSDMIKSICLSRFYMIATPLNPSLDLVQVFLIDRFYVKTHLRDACFSFADSNLHNG